MMETAVLGGGCFWCLEASFQGLKGLKSVTPGYAGGTVDHPTYEQVCSGRQAMPKSSGWNGTPPCFLLKHCCVCSLSCMTRQP